MRKLIVTLSVFAFCILNISATAFAEENKEKPLSHATFSGIIEYVDPMDGPWFIVSGEKKRMTFLCGDLHEKCTKWRYNNLEQRVTVNYGIYKIEGGKTDDTAILEKISEPKSAIDAEFNETRKLADELVFTC